MNDGPVPDHQPLDRVSVSGSFVGLGSGQLSPAKEPLKAETRNRGRPFQHSLSAECVFLFQKKDVYKSALVVG